jgi:hypothetical protein
MAAPTSTLWVPNDNLNQVATSLEKEYPNSLVPIRSDSLGNGYEWMAISRVCESWCVVTHSHNELDPFAASISPLCPVVVAWGNDEKGWGYRLYEFGVLSDLFVATSSAPAILPAESQFDPLVNSDPTHVPGESPNVESIKRLIEKEVEQFQSELKSQNGNRPSGSASVEPRKIKIKTLDAWKAEQQHQKATSASPSTSRSAKPPNDARRQAILEHVERLGTLPVAIDVEKVCASLSACHSTAIQGLQTFANSLGLPSSLLDGDSSDLPNSDLLASQLRLYRVVA